MPHQVLHPADLDLRAVDRLNAVQRLHLELIRLSRWNLFEGERIYCDLLERKALWTAALLDSSQGARSLVKLRDLPTGTWNVDTLYLLAPNKTAARALVELGETWRADRVAIEADEAAQRLLGLSHAGSVCVVSMWWD